MCTAICVNKGDFYFGRNMDIGGSFGEEVVFAPRNFPISMKMGSPMTLHYAMIGMAHVSRGCPLYADAMNEKGLSMAALRFANYAHYEEAKGKMSIAPYELIPFVLGKCATIEQARGLIGKISLAPIRFSDELPLVPLHFIIADASGAIVVEQTKDGLKVHNNPVGVLTNSPSFDFHLTNLMQHSACNIDNNKKSGYMPFFMRNYSAFGLPGDNSSASRFIRAAFMKDHAFFGETEPECVAQFFHLLGSTSVIHGASDADLADYTTYSCCMNTKKGIYYYKTYYGMRVHAVIMPHDAMDGKKLILYPLDSVAYIS